jgi:hypothetical protein
VCGNIPLVNVFLTFYKKPPMKLEARLLDRDGKIARASKQVWNSDVNQNWLIQNWLLN